MKNVKKAGATEDDLNKGFFMLPFQAAWFAERIESDKPLGRFIKSIAIHHTNQRINKALYTHFKKHTVDQPLKFTIARPVVPIMAHC